MKNIKHGIFSNLLYIGVFAILLYMFFQPIGRHFAEVFNNYMIGKVTQIIEVMYPVETASAAEIKYITIKAKVTGYNTVREQTDSTPCVGSLGTNICGRNNVAACPRILPLGTMIEIDGKQYICEDRLAIKFDDRFDISCDKDMQCPYKISGQKQIKIYAQN